VAWGFVRSALHVVSGSNSGSGGSRRGSRRGGGGCLTSMFSS